MDRCQSPRVSESGSRVWRLVLEFLYLKKYFTTALKHLPKNNWGPLRFRFGYRVEWVLGTGVALPK